MTVEVAQPTLLVGQTTTVTVSGRIAASLEEQAIQIFSWHIDLLCDDPSVAAGYSNIRTPASDNGALSSDGIPEGANLLGVYDLLTGNPGAGRGLPVVLVQFEVTALAAGLVTFRAAPGTMGLLRNDFVVEMTDGEAATGGNYSTASAAIVVLAPPDPDELDLRISVDGDQAMVAFDPLPGFDHTVQWNPGLIPGEWSSVAGAPHNSGVVLDDITGIDARHYRVLISIP